MKKTLLRFAPLAAACFAAGAAQAQTVLQVSTWLPAAHGATVALRAREGGGLVAELRFPRRVPR